MAPSRRMLNSEEAHVHDQIMRMGQVVGEVIEKALQCFSGHDTGLARDIVAGDDIIDRLHHQVEEGCITTIARQQPVAGDLRDLISCMYIAAELERIGDYAADIAGIVLQYDDTPRAEFFEGVGSLGDICRSMLSDVMSAYERGDEQLARDTAARDDEIDRLEKEFVAELLSRMRKHPDDMLSATHTLWIAHSIERIGDRVTNIAERVVYMTSGRNVNLNQ